MCSENKIQLTMSDIVRPAGPTSWFPPLSGDDGLWHLSHTVYRDPGLVFRFSNFSGSARQLLSLLPSPTQVEPASFIEPGLDPNPAV